MSVLRVIEMDFLFKISVKWSHYHQKGKKQKKNPKVWEEGEDQTNV